MGTDPIDRGIERLLGSPAGRPARRSQPAPRHAAAGRGGDSLRRSRGRRHGLLHHRLQGRRPLPHVLPGCALREEDHLLRREPRRHHLDQARPGTGLRRRLLSKPRDPERGAPVRRLRRSPARRTCLGAVQRGFRGGRSSPTPWWVSSPATASAGGCSGTSPSCPRS